MKITIVFDHRGRAKNGKVEAPVEIRLADGNKTMYIGTGVRVRRAHWRLGMVCDRPDAVELNKRVEIVRRKVEEAVNRLVEKDCKVEFAKLKMMVWGGNGKDLVKVDGENGKGDEMLEWMDEQVEMLKVKDGTRKHYRTLMIRLEEFGKMRRWSDLTVENVYMFDGWLHSLECGSTLLDRMRGGGERKRMSDAAVYNYHKCLKALVGRAVKFGKVESNVYDKLRGEFKRGDKENVEYLTEEEMERFMALKPVVGSSEDLAKDMFVVQMWTGMSYADLMAFDMGQYREVDGKWMNVGMRVKTGTAYISQLLPPVVEVLEKYGWKMPRMDSADYNHRLKALGMAAGIGVPLHSHLARHTFATFMLRNGAKVENVSKMLGHTNIVQTMRYAKVMAKSVHEDYEMVWKKRGRKRKEEEEG